MGRKYLFKLRQNTSLIPKNNKSVKAQNWTNIVAEYFNLNFLNIFKHYFRI